MTRASTLSICLSSLVLAACTPPAGEDAGGDGMTTTTNGSAESSTGPDETSSSDSSTAPSETDTADTFETNSSFISPAPPDTLQDCDPWLQDCPEGEKCAPASWTDELSFDHHKCVPILGMQGVGEACTYDGPLAATDDCELGSMCWNVQDVDGELVGTCHPLCAGTPQNPQCPDGYDCALSGNSALALCMQTCDPIVQDCPQSTACYWTGVSFECALTTLDIPIGESCGFVNDCALGLMCVTADALPACAGAACCTTFCDLASPGMTCDAFPGTECTAFFDEAPPGFEDLGICVSPGA